MDVSYNPRFNMLLNIFLVISLTFTFAFSNYTLIVVLLQMTFVFFTLLTILETKKIRLTIHFYWMLLFILWAMFTALFSVDQIQSINDILNMFMKFLFYTSILIFVHSVKTMELVVKTIAYSGLILIGRLILFTPFSNWGTERIGENLGLNPNMIGISLTFSGLLLLYYYKNKKKNYFFMIYLASIISVIMFTGSKKSLLVFAIGAFLMILIENFKFIEVLKKTFIFSPVILFIGYLMIKVPIFYNVIGMRIESLILFSTDNGIDKSTMTRQKMIEEGFLLFKENPVIGYGLETFDVISSFNGYAHNNYIEVLVSVGLIGFIFYYSLPLYLLTISIINIRQSSYSLIITLIFVTLISDIATVSYRQLITQIILTVCVAQYYLIKNEKMNKEERNEKYYKDNREDEITIIKNNIQKKNKNFEKRFNKKRIYS